MGRDDHKLQYPRLTLEVEYTCTKYITKFKFHDLGTVPRSVSLLVNYYILSYRASTGLRTWERKKKDHRRALLLSYCKLISA